MSDNWDDIAQWWANEAQTDPAYATDVHPLFDQLVPETTGTIVDLGCGEGHTMRRIGEDVIGVDLSIQLARMAGAHNRAVVGELPGLGFLKGKAFAGAYSIYLVDLIADDQSFFVETARIIEPGGWLVVIMNHPVYTAPGSSPIADDEGEVLWRWGTYFTRGSSVESGGGREIRFHHRSLGDVITDAADAGWYLESLVERPLSADTIARIPGYEGQDQIPRLCGMRWRLTGDANGSR